MGALILETYKFDDRTPTLHEIIKEIKERSGVEVDVVSEIYNDSFYKWQTDIAFSCKPDWSIQLSLDYKSTIEIETFLGCEPTLLCMTSLALQALGGEDRSISSGGKYEDFNMKYGSPVTEEELLIRFNKQFRENRLMTIFTIAIYGVILLSILCAVGLGIFLLVKFLINSQ